MKVCTRCKCEKEDTEFRVREDKRIKHKRKCIYLNNTCRECDKEITYIQHEQQKNDPEYKKKHAEWAKKAYWKNRDKLLVNAKRYRSKPSAKQNMKEYRLKNKDKIYQQEVITKERYHEKNKKQLTDKYIIRLFLNNGYPYPSAEQIEIKRAEVLINRLRKFTSKKEEGVLKKCNKCQELKDMSEFYKNGNNKVMYICKKCSNEQSKEYREKRKHNRVQ